MSGGQVCLKERCFDVFLERNNRTKHGEKDTAMNYTKHLTLRVLMSYIYGVHILDVSRSHTTTQHSR
jgi:hypothetical protein